MLHWTMEPFPRSASDSTAFEVRWARHGETGAALIRRTQLRAEVEDYSPSDHLLRASGVVFVQDSTAAGVVVAGHRVAFDEGASIELSRDLMRCMWPDWQYLRAEYGENVIHPGPHAIGGARVVIAAEGHFESITGPNGGVVSVTRRPKGDEEESELPPATREQVGQADMKAMSSTGPFFAVHRVQSGPFAYASTSPVFDDREDARAWSAVRASEVGGPTIESDGPPEAWAAPR